MAARMRGYSLACWGRRKRSEVGQHLRSWEHGTVVRPALAAPPRHAWGALAPKQSMHSTARQCTHLSGVGDEQHHHIGLGDHVKHLAQGAVGLRRHRTQVCSQ